MAAPKSNLNDLMKSPEAAALLKNKEALARIMSSPDTKALMEMLNRQAGSGLKGAADAAMKGDTKALTGIVEHLMQSKEGAEVVGRISGALPKK